MKLKSKGTAALLAFFLGGFGIHKFYLGSTKAGVLYLLFSWTCIPALIAFFDFFILLFMDDRKFNYIYNPHLNGSVHHHYHH